MSADVKAAVRDRFSAFNAGDLSRFGDLVAPGAVIYFPGMPGPLNRDGWLGLCAKMPGLRLTIEEQIAEGETVVTRWIARGPHPQDPSKQSSVHGVSIDRIVDGKVVEHREFMDQQ